MWYALTAASALFALLQFRRLGVAGESHGLDEVYRAAPFDPEARAALGWGLLCGASLAHHLTSALTLLPLSTVMVIAVVRARRWRASLLGIGVAGAVMSLSTYGFVAYRAFHWAPHQWPIDPSWAGVWRHVSGSLYTHYVGGFAPQGEQLQMIRAAVFPFLLALPLVGVWALRIRSRPMRAWLLAMLIGVALLTGFVFCYGVADPAAYFVPAMMLGNLIAIPGLLWVASRRAWVASACVLAVVGALGWRSLEHALAERDRLAIVDRNIRAAWGAIPFDHGIVLWLGDRCARLEILRILEQRRPGLYVINPNLLTWPVSRGLFARRFGFDPLDWSYSDYWAELPRHLHQRTKLPVVDFGEALERRTARGQR